LDDFSSALHSERHSSRRFLHCHHPVTESAATQIETPATIASGIETGNIALVIGRKPSARYASNWITRSRNEESSSNFEHPMLASERLDGPNVSLE
jgi:hypothetical protein